MNLIYYFKMQSVACLVTILLNDVPILTFNDSERKSLTYPISEWLKNGRNELEIVIDWPDNINFETGKAELTAEIFSFDTSSTSNEPHEYITKLKWPIENLTESYPGSLEFNFNINQQPILKLWKEAEKLPILTPMDKSMIIAVLSEFQLALEKKDYERAYGFLEYRFSEYANSKHKSINKVKNRMLSEYKILMEEPNIKRRVLIEEELLMNLVGDGQIVKITELNGADVHMFVSEEDESSIEIYMSKISDKWLIVR